MLIFILLLTKDSNHKFFWFPGIIGLEKIVLNEPAQKLERVAHPEVLVRQLLTDLTQLMQG